MTVLVFVYLVIACGGIATYFARRYLWPTGRRRAESLVFALVYLQVPLFVGREWHFLPVALASWLVWSAVVGVTLHIAVLYVRAQQPVGGE